MPHTGRVTSSSAAEGWMAMHESRSALVQPIFMATANPWITSSDAIPNMGWLTGKNEVLSLRTICSRYERSIEISFTSTEREKIPIRWIPTTFSLGPWQITLYFVMGLSPGPPCNFETEDKKMRIHCSLNGQLM